MTQVVLKQGGGGDDLRYFVKPGLAGGQVGYGGLAAGENLRLGSTAHATKGKILFGLSNYDDAVNLLNLEASVNLPTQGAEMIANAVDRDFSGPGNWVGTNWVVGGGVFTHGVVGNNTATLDAAFLTTPPVAGRWYKYEALINTTAAPLGAYIDIRIGSTPSRQLGKAVGTEAFVAVLQAIDGTGPWLRPRNGWLGSVDNLSIREITPTQAALHIRNTGQANGVEFRPGGPTLQNIAIGLRAGQFFDFPPASGVANIAIGDLALTRALTAASNIAIGAQALEHNSTGSYNVAVGHRALSELVNGAVNFAMGYESLRYLISGDYNVAVGGFCLGQNRSGNRNTAIGYNTMLTGLFDDNMALGAYALEAGQNYNRVTAIGAYAFRNADAEDGGVAIGWSAGAQVSSGQNNILIGHEAANNTTNLTTGSRNIVIGYSVGAHAGNMANCLIIGNLIYGDGLDGTGTTRATGKVGIGCTLRAAGVTYSRLNVAGDLLLVGDSTVQERQRAALKAIVVDNTDATRRYGARLSAWDTAERIALEVAASGAAPMIGFLGTAAVVKAAALTAGLTLITHTAPATPDYAIQDLAAGGFGFVTKDEGNTVLSVVLNLQTRVAELQSRLQAYGLLN